MAICPAAGHIATAKLIRLHFARAVSFVHCLLPSSVAFPLWIASALYFPEENKFSILIRHKHVLYFLSASDIVFDLCIRVLVVKNGVIMSLFKGSDFIASTA